MEKYMIRQENARSLMTQVFEQRHSNALEILSVTALGLILLTALAQIAIPLPWTPVPITGQTFGVSLIALLFGWRLGPFIVASYVLLGVLGVPLFAAATAATSGYLVGMILSSLFIGFGVDHGWAKGFFRTFLLCAGGSIFVFSCGLIGLSFFVPSETLLWAGLIPFLPGDLIKNLLASFIVVTAQRQHKPHSR